ncbi:MAG: SPOR domain-containing protein [Bernardetiaceae bacterium]
MTMKATFSYVLFFWLAWTSLLAQSPDELCLSADEMKLYTLIDNYRKGSQLHKVPLSRSLCYVAKLHAMDLAHNRQAGETCSIHSWSGKATEWQACCYEAGNAQKVLCMYEKPKQLTSYTGNGYEIITVGASSPEQAMTDWQENPSQYGAVIVNTDDWAAFDWSAVGVAIYDKYTVVWFGETSDAGTQPTLCETGSYIPKLSFMGDMPVASTQEDDIPPPEPINEPIRVSVSGKGDLLSLKSGHTYLIYGSYSTLANAQKARDLLKADGLSQAQIVEADANGMYRITLGEYAQEQQARQQKANFRAGYENVWLLINP